MNVLVLGASSAVGAGVAASFSPGNRLLLTGRDASRLRRTAERCRAAGASHVEAMEWDLRRGPGERKKAALGWRPELIINAASATSRLRDHRIAAQDLEDAVAVDLLAPLDLVRTVLAERGNRPVGVVFVSSFLSVVKSPDREIYGALKGIHEKALLGMAASQPGLRLLIVRVSKRIAREMESAETARLGSAVLNAYREGKQVVYYGAAGRLMVALFHVQPFLCTLGLRLTRLAGGRSPDPR